MMPQFKTGLKMSDFQEGTLLRRDIDGKSIVFAKINDKLFAMNSVCSHEGGPLEDGSLEGYNLTCPWHQGIFDIRNAKASPDTSWVTDLQSYTVIVEEKTAEISVNTESVPFESSKVAEIQKSPSQDEKTSLLVEQNPLPKRPLKLELSLLEKTSIAGTDIVSFKFSRTDAQNHLNYKAGQYSVVDLGTKEDPEGPTRSFTIASSPSEEDFILISTRIRDTPFKKKLASMDIGSPVNITAPLGEFVLPTDYSNPLVFLSGGIGVTPFRSMLKYVTDNQLPVKIIVFDSNRNQGNILYKEEFDEWAKLNKNLKIVYTIADDPSAVDKENSWGGERGYINQAMLTKYLTSIQLNNSIFYICGPPAMLNAMQKLLEVDLNIPKQRIKIEEFTGY
jgi:ferredoxin-NADP reductase/nitrite reductase/ring-hydroxylating ferredoxin subunit